MLDLVIRSRVLFSASVSTVCFRVLSLCFGFGFDVRCYVSFLFALFDSVFVDVFRLGFRFPISVIVLIFIYRCYSSLSFQYCIIIAIVLPFSSFTLFGFIEDARGAGHTAAPAKVLPRG